MLQMSLELTHPSHVMFTLLITTFLHISDMVYDNNVDIVKQLAKETTVLSPSVFSAGSGQLVCGMLRHDLLPRQVNRSIIQGQNKPTDRWEEKQQYT